MTTASRFDPDNDVLVFLRVPKTGSTSLARMLVAAVGQRNSAALPDRHVDGLDHGWKRAHDQLRRFGVRLSDDIAGYSKKIIGSADPIADARLLYGHHPLWAPIRTRRRRRHIIMFREPVERFLSLYFYYRAKALKRGQSSLSLEKRLAVDEDVNDAVLRILSKTSPRRLSSQCRYLARAATFETAKAELDNNVLMASTLHDLDRLNDALARYLGVPPPAVAHANAGTIRPRTNPLTPKVEARLRAALEPDRRLYDYVCENRERLILAAGERPHAALSATPM